MNNEPDYNWGDEITDWKVEERKVPNTGFLSDLLTFIWRKILVRYDILINCSRVWRSSKVHLVRPGSSTYLNSIIVVQYVPWLLILQRSDHLMPSWTILIYKTFNSFLRWELHTSLTSSGWLFKPLHKFQVANTSSFQGQRIFLTRNILGKIHHAFTSIHTPLGSLYQVCTGSTRLVWNIKDSADICSSEYCFTYQL